MRRKSPVVAQIGAQPLVDLRHDRVGIALQLLGAVLGELGDGRLRRIPVARPILVEEGRCRAQPPQRIAEHRRRLARHDAAELDAPILDAAVGGRRRRRRAEIDRARQRAGVAANLPRFGTSPSMRSGSAFGPSTSFSMIGFHWSGQIARQLVTHARIVDRDVGRHDQRVAVALLPQAVDHRRHQAQHAARALELHQRRPVRIEPVEHLRMDRIGRLQALLVVGVAALGRELLMLRAIEIGEGARDVVARR